MPKTNGNVESITKTVRAPPKRGQIKAKIMSQFVQAGRQMFSKEKVAGDESHTSQSHDDSNH